ncbi:hypothetical protein D3C84_935150 [compost metagenome]
MIDVTAQLFSNLRVQLRRHPHHRHACKLRVQYMNRLLQVRYADSFRQRYRPVLDMTGIGDDDRHCCLGIQRYELKMLQGMIDRFRSKRNRRIIRHARQNRGRLLHDLFHLRHSLREEGTEARRFDRVHAA